MFFCGGGGGDGAVVDTGRDVTIVCLVVVGASWLLGSPVKDDGCNAEFMLEHVLYCRMSQHYSQ